MTLQKPLTFLGMIVWSAVALTVHASSHGKAPETASTTVSSRMTTSDDEPTASCSDLHIQFGRRDAIVESEERTISKAEASTLRVQAEANGGIQVHGWDNDSYSVTLCKAAEDDDPTALSQIHLSLQNGDLTVTGPSSHRRWSGHLLIRSPKASALELTTKNGPLSLYNVDGQVKVSAQNGPVTIHGCSGELNLNSQNGPLTLEDNSGKQSVHAHNGPITLSLTGNSWNGASLEVEANNGPVHLQIPSGYRSGVVLESAGHSPFECNASVCSEGRKTWDDDHKRIEFGSGPALVRVSTENGPVSVATN
jgi:hypothetical protein